MIFLSYAEFCHEFRIAFGQGVIYGYLIVAAETKKADLGGNFWVMNLSLGVRKVGGWDMTRSRVHIRRFVKIWSSNEYDVADDDDDDDDDDDRMVARNDSRIGDDQSIVWQDLWQATGDSWPSTRMICKQNHHDP